MAVEKDWPLAIIGQFAVLFAAHACCGRGSFRLLARWILEHERTITKCFDPESEAGKDLAQIEKDLDDDVFERAARYSEL